jgi:hypothetical protein
MKLAKLSLSVEATNKDYFWLKGSKDNYTLVFTAGNRQPLQIIGLSKHQLLSLISLVNKQMLQETVDIIEEVVGQVLPVSELNLTQPT